MNNFAASAPCLALLTPDHYEALMALYRSLACLPGSSWDDSYPDPAETLQDLEEGRVLGLLDEEDHLLAAITLAEGDADFNGKPFWTDLSPAIALVRLGVSLPLQNRGVGRQLFLSALEEAKRRGAAGVRFMVDQNYPHAIRLYEGLGCTRVGEGSLYGMDWYFYQVQF
ncbi:MAG: GNAT family N-acetyltransferase [Clostridia bacterium]|nr:GNAT family N-acetyltransferase [Clostridia bacterium]